MTAVYIWLAILTWDWAFREREDRLALWCGMTASVAFAAMAITELVIAILEALA